MTNERCDCSQRHADAAAAASLNGTGSAKGTRKGPPSHNGRRGGPRSDCRLALEADALELGDVIDIRAIQSLVDDFYVLIPIPFAILDLQGRVLVGKGWQDICTQFHRAHPETQSNCLESDLKLTLGIAPGEFRLYKCKNNMWDVATPIMVGDRHLGNLFSGQFFFDDEPLDYELFRAQARSNGFEEGAYLAALERAPRLSRERLDAGMRYFVKLTELISQLGYSNINQARALRERDALMQTLHESEERFRVLSESSPDCIALHDLELRHLYVNPALSSLCGLDGADFLGKTVWEMGLPAETAAELDSLLRPVLTSGQENQGEFSLPADTGPLHFLWRSVPVLDADGTVKAVLAIAGNITERKRSEEALRRAHDDLERRVAERTEELTATVAMLRDEIDERERMRGSLLRLNRLYAVLSETGQAIIRAKDRASLFHDFCRIAVEQGGFLLAWVGLVNQESGQVWKVAASGATGYLDKISVSATDPQFGSGPTGMSMRTGTFHICNDFQNDPDTAPWHDRGRAYGVNASASVALKEQGRTIGTLTLYSAEKNCFDRQHVKLLVQMGTDLSFALDNLLRETSRQSIEQTLREETLERLRAVESLREKEQAFQQQTRLAAMGEMINNIAHQWRQPLNVLGLLIQQMQLFHQEGAFTAEYLETTVQKSMGLIRHMSQTIEDFSSFFRPDKEKAPFMVHEVVARTVALVEASFTNHRIRLDCRELARPVAFGFANEYAQVLLNVLSNARDALLEKGPAEPRVTLTIAQQGDRATVTIADNAGGIAEEILGKIFEPYFTTKDPDKGTGVGLYMSKTIIEKNMNGSLTARNSAEGAEFTIEV